MMEGINLYSIDYYKKTVFKGSYRGICFRIAKDEREVASGLDDSFSDDPSAESGMDSGFDDETSADESGISGGAAVEDCLRVQAWKGPFILEKTEEEVFTEFFDYSDDGLKQANEWLEQKQRELVPDS